MSFCSDENLPHVMLEMVLEARNWFTIPSDSYYINTYLDVFGEQFLNLIELLPSAVHQSNKLSLLHQPSH